MQRKSNGCLSLAQQRDLRSNMLRLNSSSCSFNGMLVLSEHPRYIFYGVLRTVKISGGFVAEKIDGGVTLRKLASFNISFQALRPLLLRLRFDLP
mmetsp:Transcript_85504/g.204922  ORF Transcript_85504/g.204922 Transcript_85504/m.204922 type:complete len:95 (+) Transcript_85504:69-353(+)